MTESRPQPGAFSLSLLVRYLLGGTLMGLANLVPGISGGTMLVSAGVYPRFVDGVAEISTLRLRWPAVLAVGTIAGAAMLAILIFAGLVKNLVVDHRWIMYSLFIGLTLGGLPVVWRMARPATVAVWSGVVAGFLTMVGLAALNLGGVGDATSSSLMLFVGGLAGASAMILPGISGGYLLLLLGQYVPILAGIDAFKTALKSGQIAAAVDPAVTVVLPVGIGVLVGVVVVSNAVRWFLANHAKATLGVLIGLLLGAVIGIWPFQQSIEPVPGETIVKGQLVTLENLAEIDKEDLPTEFFRPTSAQAMGSVGLILLGLLMTVVISRIGATGDDADY